MKDEAKSRLPSSRTEEKVIAKNESCLPDNASKKIRGKGFWRNDRGPVSACRRHVQPRPTCAFHPHPSFHPLFKTLSGSRPSAMNTTRNLIRSCSGSLSTRHLARRTVANSPRTQFLAAGSRRFYSEDSKPSEQKGEGGNNDPGSSKGESELSKQLGAKEEEVADLKVCFFSFLIGSIQSLTSVPESATVPSGRLYQPSA